MNQIELATDEDRLYGIDHWARLFKAKTWEDFRMIAKKDQAIAEKDRIIAELQAMIKN